MKKIVFWALFMLCSVLAMAQDGTDNTIDRGAAIMYFSGKPGITPDTARYAEIAYNKLSGELWHYNRDSLGWKRVVDISQGYGDPSGDPGVLPKLWINRNDGGLFQWTGAAWVEISASGGFRDDEPVLRVPEVGDTVSGFDWYYFSAPTITLALSPTTTIYEIGTSNAITLSGATTNPGAATLSGGVLTRTVPSSNTVNSFGTSTSYSQGITFSPTQAGSGDYNQQTYSFQATQNWSGSGESGTAASTTRTIRGVYPVFYGMASTDTTAIKAAIYSSLSKSVVSEGDKTYSYTGSGLIYYAFPASWSDTNLSSIKDPNNLEALSAFTRTTTTVTSTGLTNNYTSVNYIVYYLNTGTTDTSGSNYTFYQ